MSDVIERVNVSPRGRDDELKTLAQVLTQQRESGELMSFSFLLSGNKDMGVNDFSRGIREMMDCPADQVHDITEKVLAGERF